MRLIQHYWPSLVLTGSLTFGSIATAADFPSGDASVENVRVLRVWVDRELKGSGASARLFVRFNKTVCSAPTGSGNSLAGLDITSSTRTEAELLLRLGMAAKVSGKRVEVRTNNGTDNDLGCELVRLEVVD